MFPPHATLTFANAYLYVDLRCPSIKGATSKRVRSSRCCDTSLSYLAFVVAPLLEVGPPRACRRTPRHPARALPRRRRRRRRLSIPGGRGWACLRFSRPRRRCRTARRVCRDRAPPHRRSRLSWTSRHRRRRAAAAAAAAMRAPALPRRCPPGGRPRPAVRGAAPPRSSPQGRRGRRSPQGRRGRRPTRRGRRSPTRTPRRGCRRGSWS